MPYLVGSGKMRRGNRNGAEWACTAYDLHEGWRLHRAVSAPTSRRLQSGSIFGAAVDSRCIEGIAAGMLLVDVRTA
jgi:hypothetical protein